MRKRKHVPSSSIVLHKRRRGANACVCFSDDDFEVAPPTPSGPPPGPASYEELSNWPCDLLHRACSASESAVNRMREFVAHGLQGNSDYSGYDCPREMLTQLFKAFTYSDYFACQHSPTLRFTRSCDNADLPLRVLRHLAQVNDRGESCVNTDIEGCLTQEAKDHLDDMVVDANQSSTSNEELKVSLKEAYASMSAWLIENRGSVFAPELCSPCVIHGRDCPMAARLPDGDGRLLLNFAGTTCVGWSTVGKRGGFSDGSERTHAVWMTQRICMAEQRKEHGFFQECTRYYPVNSKLVQPLKRWFWVVHVQVCGTWIGYPSKRLRSLAFGGHHDSLLWCGPETPEKIQEEFDALFCRTTVLTGDSYLVAPEATVAAVYAKLASKRHNYWDPNAGVSLLGRGMLRSILTGAQLMRLQEYEDTYRRNTGMEPEKLIVDVEQNVGSPGDTSGPMFPSQLKHNTFYSCGKRRLCTGLEGMVANGWHIFENETSKFSSDLAPFLKTLTESQLKSLSGNGMSLPPLCAWFLFVAMNTRRRESAQPSRGLCHIPEEDDEVDDVHACSTHVPDSTGDDASESLLHAFEEGDAEQSEGGASPAEKLV